MTGLPTCAAVAFVAAGCMWCATSELAGAPRTELSARQVATVPVGNPGRSVWERVYSDAQAKRGEATYLKECAPCHGDDLRGSGPAVALGPDDFFFLWERKTLGELFERIRTRMPPDRPDSLGPDAYRDIVAFLLKANNVPAGPKDLDADTGVMQVIITATPPNER